MVEWQMRPDIRLVTGAYIQYRIVLFDLSFTFVVLLFPASQVESMLRCKKINGISQTRTTTRKRERRTAMIFRVRSASILCVCNSLLSHELYLLHIFREICTNLVESNELLRRQKSSGAQFMQFMPICREIRPTGRCHCGK